jgi:hypothetical protein
MKPETVTMPKGLMSMQHNEKHVLVSSPFTPCGMYEDNGCKYSSVLLSPALNLQECQFIY